MTRVRNAMRLWANSRASLKKKARITEGFTVAHDFENHGKYDSYNHNSEKYLFGAQGITLFVRLYSVLEMGTSKRPFTLLGVCKKNKAQIEWSN